MFVRLGPRLVIVLSCLLVAGLAAFAGYWLPWPAAAPPASALVGLTADEAHWRLGTRPCVLPMEWGEYRYYETRDGSRAYRLKVEGGIVTAVRDSDAAELRRRARKGGAAD